MRLDVYHVAYEEANSELIDITNKVEQLRQRKERLEAVVAAIGPILEGAASATVAAERVIDPVSVEPQLASEPTGYTFNQVTVPVAEVEENGGDPFQRRVRNALKFRSYSQEHQGLQTAV